MASCPCVQPKTWSEVTLKDAIAKRKVWKIVRHFSFRNQRNQRNWTLQQHCRYTYQKPADMIPIWTKFPLSWSLKRRGPPLSPFLGWFCVATGSHVPVIINSSFIRRPFLRSKYFSILSFLHTTPSVSGWLFGSFQIKTISLISHPLKER